MKSASREQKEKGRAVVDGYLVENHKEREVFVLLIKTFVPHIEKIEKQWKVGGML